MEKQIVDFTESGELIRRAREMQGMTAIQLCDQIERCTGRKINEHALMRIERGQEPKVSVLLDICATLFPGYDKNSSTSTNAVFFTLAAGGINNMNEILALGNLKAKAELDKAAAEVESIMNQPAEARAAYIESKGTQAPFSEYISSMLSGLEFPSMPMPSVLSEIKFPSISIPEETLAKFTAECAKMQKEMTARGAEIINESKNESTSGLQVEVTRIKLNDTDLPGEGQE